MILLGTVSINRPRSRRLQREEASPCLPDLASLDERGGYVGRHTRAPLPKMLAPEISINLFQRIINAVYQEVEVLQVLVKQALKEFPKPECGIWSDDAFFLLVCIMKPLLQGLS